MFKSSRPLPSDGSTSDRGTYRALGDELKDVEFVDDEAASDELVDIRKKLRFFKLGFYGALVTQGLVFLYWILHGYGESRSHATYRELSWSGLLGEDWNGLVPNGKFPVNERKIEASHLKAP
jgi:hypothetical protein